MPTRRTLAPVHPLLHRGAQQVPGESGELQRLPPKARVHAGRQRARGDAQLRRGTPRKGARLPPNRALREGVAQAQGVGGAALRGGQGVARFSEVQAKGAGEGQLRGPHDRLRSKRQAATDLRSERSEENGAGCRSSAARSRPFRLPRSPRTSPGLHSAPRGTFFNTLVDSPKFAPLEQALRPLRFSLPCPRVGFYYRQRVMGKEFPACLNRTRKRCVVYWRRPSVRGKLRSWTRCSTLTSSAGTPIPRLERLGGQTP